MLDVFDRMYKYRAQIGDQPNDPNKKTEFMETCDYSFILFYKWKCKLDYQ